MGRFYLLFGVGNNFFAPSCHTSQVYGGFFFLFYVLELILFLPLTASPVYGLVLFLPLYYTCLDLGGIEVPRSFGNEVQEDISFSFFNSRLECT